MKTTDRTIKTLTYLAFAGLILATQSCAKDNSSGLSETENKAYVECSRVSALTRCVVQESHELLSAHDFYDYYCYEDYKACLKAVEFKAQRRGRY